MNDKGLANHAQMPYSLVKKDLHRQVIKSYEEGNIQNASDVEDFLNAMPNVTVDRRKGKGGDKILRVYVKGHKKAMRLEGALFHRHFNAKEFEDKKEIPPLTKEQKVKELARLEKKINEQDSKRVKHNQRVYPQHKVRDIEQEIVPRINIKDSDDPVRERIIRDCEATAEDIQREVGTSDGATHEGFGELQSLFTTIGNKLEGWVSEVGDQIKGVVREIKKIDLVDKYISKFESKSKYKNRYRDR